MNFAQTQLRFDKYVVKTSGCWFWTGGTTKIPNHSYYGRFRIGDKMYGAHVVSWALTHAIDVSDVDGFVCHSCNVPLCVNPDHLYLGNAKTNSEDRWKRVEDLVRLGLRSAPQSKTTTRRNKLHSFQVECIKKLLQVRLTCKQVSKMFPIVSPKTISNIKNGYIHVSDAVNKYENSGMILA